MPRVVGRDDLVKRRAKTKTGRSLVLDKPKEKPAREARATRDVRARTKPREELVDQKAELVDGKALALHKPEPTPMERVLKAFRAVTAKVDQLVGLVTTPPAAAVIEVPDPTDAIVRAIGTREAQIGDQVRELLENTVLNHAGPVLHWRLTPVRDSRGFIKHLDLDARLDS